VTIRDAVAADAEAIAGIRVASWRATYAGVVPQSVLDRLDVARNVAWLTERLADPGTTSDLVIEDGGRVVGYALLAVARDPDADGLGEVEAIYLAPGATGRGLGGSLMDAAVARLAAAGHFAVVLWVLTANAGARRFYERAGFFPDGAARMLEFDGTPIEEIRYRRSIG
jgi:GNAT superfamily N-acetyltransferase